MMTYYNNKNNIVLYNYKSNNNIMLNK